MSNYDFDARELICKDIYNNYFVEAGAGSGKTTCLVDRMLSMVEGGIDIDKICAITFTKAAANEFYDRFRKKLAKSNSQNAKRALQNIDLCFMGTIDSFCNMIISEHPAKAQVPSDSRIIDKEYLEDYCLNFLYEVANNQYGNELYIKYRKVVENNKSANNVILPALNFILSHKNADLVFDLTNNSSQKIDLDLVFADQKKDLLKFFKWVKNNKYFFKDISSVRDSYKYLDWCIKKLEMPWQSLDDISFVLSKFKFLCIDKDVDLDNIPNDDNNEISVLLKKFFVMKYKKDLDEDGNPKKDCWALGSLKDNVDSLYLLTLENYNLSLILDFSINAAKIISAKLRKKGLLTFSDYLFYLSEMLKNDAANEGKLIEHIYSRHSYFLIDEFQDTDPVQAEIFFYLSAKKLNADWKKCIPYVGSLFIVGDPKQSIYRFRNADVTSYLNVKNLFNNADVGRVLELSQNFRSSKPMCKWFNEAFDLLLPDIVGLQSKFSKIPLDSKVNYQGSFGGVYKHTFSNKMKKADSIDCINVSNIVREIVNNEKFTIQDPADKDGNIFAPRKIKYEDIMIIVSKKSHLKDYMRALKKNHVPYLIEGNVLFDECPSLSAVLALFNWICEPENKKAQFAVRKIANVVIDIDRIFNLQNYFMNLSPCSAFMYLLDEFKILANVGTQNLEYLYYALELLRDKEVSGDVLDIYDAASFISQLVNDVSELERCLQFVSNTNRVHLANLHKVKGLEAPVVLLADPKTTRHNPSTRIEFSNNGVKSYLFELKVDNFSSLHSYNFIEQKKQEKDALDAEKMRLLYVAATRAGCALVISDVRNDWKKTKKIPDTNPWAAFLTNNFDICDLDIKSNDEGKLTIENKNLDNLSHAEIFDDANTLYNKAIRDNILNNDAKAPSYKIILPSKRHNDEGFRSLDFEDKKEQTFDIINKDEAIRNSRLIGTTVHRLMELVCNAKSFDDDNLKFIDQVVCEYKLCNDHNIDYLHTALVQAKSLFDELKNAQEIYCELPFCYETTTKEICDGVVDLLYKKDNKWFVLDYKTNYDERYLDVVYKDQLNLYVEALKNIEGIEAEARIFHISV